MAEATCGKRDLYFADSKYSGSVNAYSGLHRALNILSFPNIAELKKDLMDLFLYSSIFLFDSFLFCCDVEEEK